MFGEKSDLEVIIPLEGKGVKSSHRFLSAAGVLSCARWVTETEQGWLSTPLSSAELVFIWVTDSSLALLSSPLNECNSTRSEPSESSRHPYTYSGWPDANFSPQLWGVQDGDELLESSLLQIVCPRRENLSTVTMLPLGWACNGSILTTTTQPCVACWVRQDAAAMFGCLTRNLKYLPTSSCRREECRMSGTSIRSKWVLPNTATLTDTRNLLDENKKQVYKWQLSAWKEWFNLLLIRTQEHHSRNTIQYLLRDGSRTSVLVSKSATKHFLWSDWWSFQALDQLKH